MTDPDDPDAALTDDGFLGGRLRLLQPRRGFRSGSDAVLLAAAVPAVAGESVLDLGCGAGAAALCLAARVAGLTLHGLESQPGYAGLARRNAARNGIALAVHDGDVADLPPALRALRFDHVMANPPFFPSGETLPGADPGRDRARRDAGTPLAVWVAAGTGLLRAGGTLTLIQRAGRLGAILGALDGRAGGTIVLPLAPGPGREAGRVIVRARRGRRGPLRLLAPFVLHDPGDGAGGQSYSAAATRVLRDGHELFVNPAGMFLPD
jgi:tRNA1(Val) A37 N6-methylase TrmN6